MVGVVKEKLYGRSRFGALTVTSNFVAYGSCAAGVKMSVVVPDQRNVPFTSGAMWNHGMVRFFGILPTATIASLNTTRISFASARVASSPTGPALTTVSFFSCENAVLAASRTTTAKRFMRAKCNDGLWPVYGVYAAGLRTAGLHSVLSTQSSALSPQSS